MARKAGRPEIVQKLVEDISAHLVQSGYQKGDKYLPVRQVAVRFNVSLVTAHKALQRLIDSKNLTPRKGVGTFINKVPKLKLTAGELARRVVRIIHLDDKQVHQRIARGGLEEGIRKAIPACDIECYPVAATDAKPMATLVRSMDREDVLGNILIRVSREMRQFFEPFAKNTIVLGQTEPNISLASAGRDQRQIGKLAMRAMLQRKHQRIALVMHSDWGFGDNELVAGMQDEMNSGSKRANLTIRSTPEDEAVSKPVIQELLDQEQRPTAVICRSDAIAITAAKVARRMKLKLGSDLAILSLGSDSPTLSRRRPAIAAMTNNDLANGEAAGGLLLRLVRCQATVGTHVSLPVAIAERTSLG